MTATNPPPAAETLTDRFWLIVHQPGCVPNRKGPWPHRETAKVLREFMAAKPTAFIHHLTIGDDGTPDVEHGPLVLQYTDGRSMSVGTKHNERTRAAALAASPEQPASATMGGAVEKEPTAFSISKRRHEEKQAALAERSTRVDGDREAAQIDLPTDRYGETCIDRLTDLAENGTIEPQLREDLRAILALSLPAESAKAVDREAVTYEMLVEAETRVLAAEMIAVRLARTLRKFAAKADKWEANHSHSGADSTQVTHRLGDFRAARAAIREIDNEG